MSLRKPAKDQPESFEFNSSSLEAAKSIVSKYPEGKQQSAVMALLYIAQKQNNNWIPLAAMKYIAKFLEMPYIKVYEVATFYTMYNLSPVGKYFVQVCTTTPCMIRGANKLVEACKEKISEKLAIIIFAILIVFDLVSVNRVYVNTDNFVNARQVDKPYQSTSADKKILKDKTHFRVLDASREGQQKPARAAYFHNSLSGYHAAKLNRFEALLDFHIYILHHHFLEKGL